MSETTNTETTAPAKKSRYTGKRKSEKVAAKKVAKAAASKKVTAPKAKAAKPAAAPRVRGDLPPEKTIAWKGENPAREGSDRHARWRLLEKSDGKTVEKFLAAGGNSQTLRNAIKSGNVKLT
jgi:hypothetical protein